MMTFGRTCLFLAALFAFVGMAFAQVAEITWPDNVRQTIEYGTTSDAGNVHLSFRDWRLVVHNGGTCDPNPGATAKRPKPLWIAGIDLLLPDDWTCPLGIMVGARRRALDQATGLRRWTIVQPGDWEQPANPPTNTYPEYVAPATGLFRIEGGKRLRIDVAPAADPWRLADLTPTAEDRNACLAVWKPDLAAVARMPGLQRCIRDVWRYNARSLDRTIPNGQRNKGGALDPWQTAARTGIKSDTWQQYANPWMAGVKETTTATRAGAYDQPVLFALTGLLMDDPGTLQIARFELLYMIAQGLLDCDDVTCTHHGDWCGEHSIGGPMGAVLAKSNWDLAIAGMAKLWPKDPDIQEAYQLRRWRCANQVPWWGGGGARNPGNAIMAQWFMWRSTGDVAIANRAKREIGDVLTKYVGTTSWVRENPGSTGVSGGEGIRFLIYARKFADAGICPEHTAKLNEMIEYFLDHGGRYVDMAHQWWQACYFWDALDPLKNNWGGNVFGAAQGGYKEEGIFLLPLGSLVSTERAAQMRANERMADAQFLPGGANVWWDQNTSTWKWHGVAGAAICGG